MNQKSRIALSLFAAGLATAPLLAAGEAGAGALQDLRGLYPGARFYSEDDRMRIVYGTPMTVGATPRQAAESWLMSHGGTFGAGQLELEETFATTLMSEKFTAFGYRQYINGLPVEYGNIRVLVLNEPVPRVVYAGATAAPASRLQERMELDGDTARTLVQAMPLFRGLKQWGEPELAIFQGNGDWIDPTVVWKFTGDDGLTLGEKSYTFFVEAGTGRLLHVRNEIYTNEVTGSVKAWATPGVVADIPSNPPTLQIVEDIAVRIPNRPTVYTGFDGLFSIPNAGTTQVNATTGVRISQGYGGRWVDVQPATAAPLQLSIPVTPPGQANFILNPAPTEHLTAQANAFIGTTLAHNFFKSRAPQYTALDIALPAHTNASGTCNAFFYASGPHIAFLNAGGGCPNTAYSSVISHEYGHFVVNRLNHGQGGFGEGYGDTMGMLVYDDGVVGRGFLNPNNPLRDPIAANVQYPCSGGVHHCGQILAGAWWRMRNNLVAAHGQTAGVDKVRDRFVAWSIISTGGTGSNFLNSAHPATAIQALIVDDDDGNLANGTPNWHQICNAFSAHSIACPPLTYLDFELPQGEPGFITPGVPLEVPVNVINLAGTAQAESGMLFYRLPGGSFTSVAMVPTGTNQYLATLPALDCGQHIDFYFSAKTTANQTINHPPTAPQTFFSATAGTPATEPVLQTSFQHAWPTGWSATGLWHVTGGCAQSGNAVSGCEQGPYAYYGRTATCNLHLPTGTHSGSLQAPLMTMPTIPPNGGLSLKFCYALETMDHPNRHIAQLYVNGQTRPEWRLPDIRPTAAEPDRYWGEAEFDLSEFSGQNVELSWRFDTNGTWSNDFRGWHVNNIRVDAVVASCQAACYANCDGSTTQPLLNVEDFTCFINAFAEGQQLPHAQQINHYANCDGSTTAPVLSVEDFTCFINAYAAGCP